MPFDDNEDNYNPPSTSEPTDATPGPGTYKYTDIPTYCMLGILIAGTRVEKVVDSAFHCNWVTVLKRLRDKCTIQVTCHSCTYANLSFWYFFEKHWLCTQPCLQKHSNKKPFWKIFSREI